MKRLFASVLLGVALAAQAQVFPIPGRPIRIVVPFPPGGQTDVQARAIAAKLAPSLGVPVVVENKPGGASIPGTMEVVKAAPDGHTLLYTIGVTAVQNPHLYSKLPYEPFRDLTPLMITGTNALVVIANGAAPFNSMAELVEYARRNPGKLNYASFSAGSSSHLLMELLKQKYGLDIVHVPFKGSADANLALMSGEVQVMMDGPTTALSAARTGKVKVIGYADDRRNPSLPDVPSFAETGMGGFTIPGGMHMFGPAGMPRDTVRRVNAALADAMRQPEVIRTFTENGMELVASSPEEHTRLLREWYEYWGGVIRRLGVRLD